MAGGHPSPTMSSKLLLVGAVAAHLGTRVVNPYDSDGVPVTVEQLLLPMMPNNGGEVVNDLSSGIEGKQYFHQFLSNVDLCQTLCVSWLPN